jgi:hypothetical protein
LKRNWNIFRRRYKKNVGISSFLFIEKGALETEANNLKSNIVKNKNDFSKKYNNEFQCIDLHRLVNYETRANIKLESGID